MHIKIGQNNKVVHENTKNNYSGNEKRFTGEQTLNIKGKNFSLSRYNF